MTPTPEIMELARKCAAKYWQTGEPSDEWTASKILSGEWDDQAYTQAALTAIMEVRERVSEMADGRRTDDGSLWDAAMEDFGDAIRNGEHLR